MAAPAIPTVCDPFNVTAAMMGPLPTAVGRFVATAAERLLAFPTLNDLHRRIVGLGNDRPVCDRALRALDVVANHPPGGLDGLALAAVVGRVRPDARVLANRALGVIPESRCSS